MPKKMTFMRESVLAEAGREASRARYPLAAVGAKEGKWGRDAAALLFQCRAVCFFRRGSSSTEGLDEIGILSPFRER
jgi:hypothetical protein